MRLSRRLSILLLISLGGNLFLSGMLFTQWLAATPPDMTGPFNRHAAVAALSEEQRQVVERIWQRHEAKAGERVKAAREVRRRIRRQLEADPFDRAALEQSFVELREAMVPLGIQLFGTIVEIADSLPLAERKRFFEAGFAASAPSDPLERLGPPSGPGPGPGSGPGSGDSPS